MTWSPLACGIITGKYENGIPETSRASMKVLKQMCGLVIVQHEGFNNGINLHLT